MRGYFGIGIYKSKTETNIGTLWRSAFILGASFIFTIGNRYNKQGSDTCQSHKHIPLFHYIDINDFKSHVPDQCKIIGIELHPSSKPLHKFIHPERCVYLLGAEDIGLDEEALSICHSLIQIEGLKEFSLNVQTAGSIVMHDRLVKSLK